MQNPSSPLNASLAKANRLLLAFSESSPELGVMELARRAGLDKSTVSRFVATLHQLGLLERVEDGRRYRLALALFELGMLAVRHRPIFERLERTLEGLAAESGRTALLTVAAERDVLVLGKVEGRDGSPFAVGRRYPAACCAAGKILLAQARPAMARAAAAGAARPDGAGDRSASTAGAVTEVRAPEFSTDHEELFAGIASVAVAVLDRHGQPLGALALSGPSGDLDRAGLEGLVPALQRAAGEIARRVGQRAPGRRSTSSGGTR